MQIVDVNAEILGMLLQTFPLEVSTCRTACFKPSGRNLGLCGGSAELCPRLRSAADSFSRGEDPGWCELLGSRGPSYRCAERSRGSFWRVIEMPWSSSLYNRPTDRRGN